MPHRPQSLASRSRVAGVLVTGLLASLALAPAAHAKTVTVTQAKSGKSVTLTKGDTLVVRLAENPSTGYVWKTITKPAFLRLVSSKYAPNQVTSDTPLVGGGGKRTFKYAAKAKGKGTLKLVYRRASSTDDVTPFTLKITVR